MNRFKKRLLTLWRRKELERDLEDELGFHAAMKTAASGDELQARRSIGNLTGVKAECRSLWTFTFLESCWQDARYAIRTLVNNPAITLAAVLALALGIGANTAVYTIVSKALAFDLGVDQVERIVLVSLSDNAQRGISLQPYLNYRDLLPQIRSLKMLAAYSFNLANVSDAMALPDRLKLVQLTASGFAIMGRQPMLGRGLQPSDERPDASPVLVLSYRVWQNRYGKDPSIVGRVVRVDESPRVVIGVMPANLRFPEDAELWTPLSPSAVQGRDLALFGRLADGKKLAEARAELDTIARRMSSQSPPGHGFVADVTPILAIYGVYDSRPMFYAVLVAVGFVLLIACANVANLLLARAAARGREISVRIAIGAGRIRILRQLLLESVTLSLAGGFFGWMLAALLLHWFDISTAKFPRPAWIDFSMHAPVFVYLSAISIGTGILFGLGPALRLAQVDVNSAVKDGGQGSAGTMRGLKLANLLVIFEMTLCVVLMMGAGLLIRSSLNLYAAPMGADTTNVLTMQVSLPVAKYSHAEDLTGFHDRLIARLESLPGVEAASVASVLPGTGWASSAFELEGAKAPDPSRLPTVGTITVGQDYFRVLRVSAVNGRFGSDTATIAVNQAFASQQWPGENPLGKHIRLAGPRGPQTWLTVAAIMPNIHQNPRRPLERGPLVYIPYQAAPQRTVSVLARTSVPPATLVDAFRREVQALDENLPAYDVRSLDSRLEQNRLNVTSVGALFTIFGLIALILASVGLYGVMAHSVGQRTREIGVRMAVGGSNPDIVKMIFAQGMRQIALGLAIGLPLAFAVTLVLRGTLVGISPGDPVTFLSVTGVLTCAGALGCALPAYRAVKIDPVVALRCD